MQYATIEDVEVYCGFTNPSEPERALLDTLITVASAMIDNECGRVFGIPEGEAATTRTFTQENGLLPVSGRLLYMPDDLYDVAGVPTLDPAVTITYMGDRPPYYGLLRSDGIWEDPTSIIAHWAYSETPPAFIVNMTCRLVQWLYHQRESVQSQGNTVNTPNRLPADVKQGLAHYRRIKLP